MPRGTFYVKHQNGLENILQFIVVFYVDAK